MNEEEKKAIANFKYWIDTNTEKGVCYLPDYICAKVLNLIEKLQKENEHKAEKIENQKNELAILNEKQKDFNKLKNTAKSWEGQYRRTLKENKNLKATNKDLQKSVDMIYADYQDIGNKAFEYSDKIEQLQTEVNSLKARLEYKQYGDLDNIEFERYINDIVETKTKELKEQLEEEQELNKIIKETRINKILENNIEVKKLREENENLRKELNEENKRCMMLAVEKQDYLEKYEYHKKQNESLSKEFSNCIPISKLKEEVLNLMKEAHDKAIKGFIKTDAPECSKYSAIAQELGYFIGKIEELIEGEENNK